MTILQHMINHMSGVMTNCETVHAISLKTGLRQETIKRILCNEVASGNVDSFAKLFDYYCANYKNDLRTTLHVLSTFANK